LWSQKDSTGKAVTGVHELRIINLDGSGERLVVRKYAQTPEVSPDGSMLSFTCGDSGYIVNADGSGLRPLVPSEPGLPIERVSWSADWDYVVFSAKYDNVVHLFVVNRDGSGKKLLTEFNGGHLLGYGWSPDGKRIAFSYGSGQPGSVAGGALYVINAEGTDLKKITDDLGAFTEVHWVPVSQ
jgi:Tol biopolymer transport system component